MTIQEMRQEMMLSKKELAEKMGVSEGTVVKWEKGERKQSKRHCNTLMELYNQSNTMKFSGEIIKQIRKSKGLTQEEFAKALGVGASTVRDWEHDRHEIKAEHKRKVFDFCAKEMKGVKENEIRNKI